MPITERGRWSSTVLDERGKRIFNGITEIGGMIFGIPSNPLNIIVQDNFNRANTAFSLTGLGNAQTGQAWQTFSGYNPNGAGRINANQAEISGSDNGQVINAGISDGDITVKFVSLANNPQLIFRANMSNTTHTFVEYSSGSWHIFRYEGGAVWTELANGGPAGANGDIIKVTLLGNSIKVYRNGTQIMSANDSQNVTSTYHGLGCGASNALFDDFTIASVTSTIPVPSIVSTSKTVISDEVGMNTSQITFRFDIDVTQWEVRVFGAGQGTGTLADSGGSVVANTNITATIDWTELYQEGINKVNIYGRGSNGTWTPYE